MMNTVPSSTATTATGEQSRITASGKHNRAGKLLYGVHPRGTVGVH